MPREDSFPRPALWARFHLDWILVIAVCVSITGRVAYVSLGFDARSRAAKLKIDGERAYHQGNLKLADRLLAEAARREPGDIWVAPGTMPAWTPLFASIAAVVTDAGGVLSHAAIVAREYNIPAVLGTGNATRKIEDGHTIEVDGDEGVVRIVP